MSATLCSLSGFLVQFFFLTSMSFLSAITFDVAQSMSRLYQSGTAEYRRYLALSYCVPLAVTLLTLIAELSLKRCSWAWPGMQSCREFQQDMSTQGGDSIGSPV